MRNHWKWFVTVLVVAGLLFASPVFALAAKTEATTITTIFNSDNTVTLTATTLKVGSAYSDYWTGATKVSTVLRSDGYYVSTATFSAAGLDQGDYPVGYHITMTAGKSGVMWTGDAATTITVGPDGTSTKTQGDF